MLVYKVCKVVDLKFYSSFAKEEFRLEYKIGEETTPNIGKLFAFRDLDAAIHYLNYIRDDENDHVVFSAEAEVVSAGDMIPNPTLSCLWGAFWSNGSYAHTSVIPNTVLCSSIKLLKQLS